MTNKPHLAIYPEPVIRDGSNVETLCGEALMSVKIVGFSDVAVMGEQWKSILNSLNCCPECNRAAGTLAQAHPQDVKFVYSVVERNSKLGQKLTSREALEESA